MENWNQIIGKKIHKLYYFDEYNDTGVFLNTVNAHLLEQGQIILELSNKEAFEIYADEEGLLLAKIELKDEFKSNKVDLLRDPVWNHISDKEISIYNILQIKLEKKAIKNKWISIEYNNTIELQFKNGERIYISNAGYITEDEIIPFTDDLLVYNKKSVGARLKLFS